MKNNKIVLGILFIISGILVNFYLLLSQYEIPQLQYQVFEKEELNGIRFFEHLVENVGDKEVKINFLSDKEVDVSVQSESPINFTNIVGQEHSKFKNGRTISLKPGEKLSNIIFVNTEDLPKGEYELLIRLALEDINAKQLRLKFTIK